MKTVYSIGFLAGNVAPPDGDMEHRVRLGRDVHVLNDFEGGLWGAAQLIADPEHPTQDREAVIELHGTMLSEAVGLDLRNDAFREESAAAFDRLAELGLLVEVDDLDEFAKNHTFRALLTGLGEADEHRELVGAPGHPLHDLDPREYGTWTGADAATTIVDFLESRFGDDTLSSVLTELHRLQERGLGYLDRVVDQDAPVRYVGSGRMISD